MLGLVSLPLAVGAAVAWVRSPPTAVPEPPRLRVLAPTDEVGFARARASQPFEWPRDHGPHYDYQTEWWYYTGHLEAPAGERFGYQLTFFRRGLTPSAPEGRGLHTNQVYFAHFAITDVAAESHRAAERASRGAGGLAGAEGEPFQVWLEDWTARSLGEDGGQVRLEAREGDMALELELLAAKPLVAHGNVGLSRKSDEPGNASYYVSFTRMTTEGRIELGGRGFAVRGESWFDHEWSTSALGPSAVGWDWFSLQLEDDRELMFFQIRREDGTVERVSGGSLVEPDGSVRPLGVSEVDLAVLDRWRSPVTRAEYPAGWQLEVPSACLTLRLSPLVSDQELRTSFVYWEGAVSVEGTRCGAPVTGRGYVELTGYARSMQGVF